MPHPPNVTDVLFDVDGVCVYPTFAFRDWLQRVHGITPKMTETFFQTRFPACLIGAAGLEDALADQLDAWGWPGTLDDFINAWLRQENLPNHDLLALVATTRARGIRCHIASVQETRRASYLRYTMGFGSLFDTMLFSCDLGVTKPNPEFYARAQTILGREPNQLLLVDDTLACIKAAQSAGWSSFHYTGPSDQSRLAQLLAGLPA